MVTLPHFYFEATLAKKSVLANKSVKLRRQHGEEKALKNIFYNKQTLTQFFKSLEREKYITSSHRIIPTILNEIAPFELKARVNFLADYLTEILSEKEIVRLLTDAGKGKFDHWPAFTFWPLLQLIQRKTDYSELYFNWLKDLTSRFTAEFAIRPLMDLHGQKYFKLLTELSSSANEHHRRWLSEGLRPYLPWGIRSEWVLTHYKTIFEVVEKMRNDQSLYVRKSVANHLNDLTRLDAEFALERVSAWGDSPEEKWIKKHGLRNLIKKGDKAALSLIGIVDSASVDLVKFAISPARLNLGESLKVICKVKNLSKNRCKVQVDLVVVFYKSRTKQTEKVFKGKEINLEAGETVEFEKNLTFKPITTRSYEEGWNKIALRINGETSKFKKFYIKF